MRYFSAASAIIGLILMISVWGPAIDPQGTNANAVPRFHVENLTLVDTLLRLAQQQHFPLGIEYIDVKAVTDPISLDTGPAPLGQVLSAILRLQVGYSWSVQDGVVRISHSDVPVGTANLLSHTLPDFIIPRMSITEASLALDHTLYADLNPGTVGWAGSYAGEISATKVGPYSMRSVTVREVLNRMVRDAGDAAWVVQVTPRNLDKLPSYGLWRVVEYAMPPQPPRLYSHLFKAVLLRKDQSVGLEKP